MIQVDDDNKGDGVTQALIVALSRAVVERDRLAIRIMEAQRRINDLEREAADNLADFEQLRDGTGRFAPKEGRVTVVNNRGMFTPDGGGSQ